MSYAHEMQAARSCMERRDWSGAYRHFHTAHDLGHAIRGQHLGAHRAALLAALRAYRPDRLLYQLVFLGFASLTSWRRATA